MEYIITDNPDVKLGGSCMQQQFNGLFENWYSPCCASRIYRKRRTLKVGFKTVHLEIETVSDYPNYEGVKCLEEFVVEESDVDDRPVSTAVDVARDDLEPVHLWPKTN